MGDKSTSYEPYASDLRFAAALALKSRHGGAPDGKATSPGATAFVAPPGEPQAVLRGPRRPPASPPPTRLARPCGAEPALAVPTSQGLPAPLKPVRPLPPCTTTLLVRNIPARFNQERLLEVWPTDGTFNFLYLPFHASSARWPAGHAFVNFMAPELALAFQEQWHGHRLCMDSRRTKELKITAAPVQGVCDNLEVLLRRDFAKLGKQANLPALFYGTCRVNTKEVLRIMHSDRKRASAELINYS